MSLFIFEVLYMFEVKNQNFSAIGSWAWKVSFNTYTNAKESLTYGNGAAFDPQWFQHKSSVWCIQELFGAFRVVFDESRRAFYGLFKEELFGAFIGALFVVFIVVLFSVLVGVLFGILIGALFGVVIGVLFCAFIASLFGVFILVAFGIFIGALFSVFILEYHLMYWQE